MIAVLRNVVDAGSGEGASWAAMRLHRIHSDVMDELGELSKLNAEWPFLTMLRDEGRRAAEAFGREHGADIGVRSTFDFDACSKGSEP